MNIYFTPRQIAAYIYFEGVAPEKKIYKDLFDRAIENLHLTQVEKRELYASVNTLDDLQNLRREYMTAFAIEVVEDLDLKDTDLRAKLEKRYAEKISKVEKRVEDYAESHLYPTLNEEIYLCLQNHHYNKNK